MCVQQLYCKSWALRKNNLSDVVVGKVDIVTGWVKLHAWYSVGLYERKYEIREPLRPNPRVIWENAPNNQKKCNYLSELFTRAESSSSILSIYTTRHSQPLITRGSPNLTQSRKYSRKITTHVLLWQRTVRWFTQMPLQYHHPFRLWTGQDWRFLFCLLITPQLTAGHV